MEFELLEKESLSKYTTLHIGGEADFLAKVRSEDELRAAALTCFAETRGIVVW